MKIPLYRLLRATPGMVEVQAVTGLPLLDGEVVRVPDLTAWIEERYRAVPPDSGLLTSYETARRLTLADLRAALEPTKGDDDASRT